MHAGPSFGLVPRTAQNSAEQGRSPLLHCSQYTPSLATLLTFVSPAEVSFQSERPCF